MIPERLKYSMQILSTCNPLLPSGAGSCFLRPASDSCPLAAALCLYMKAKSLDQTRNVTVQHNVGNAKYMHVWIAEGITA
jgi:hypothetical protein